MILNLEELKQVKIKFTSDTECVLNKTPKLQILILQVNQKKIFLIVLKQKSLKIFKPETSSWKHLCVKMTSLILYLQSSVITIILTTETFDGISLGMDLFLSKFTIL